MKREIINSTKAPTAIGPYSQAVRVGSFIFCSGQVGTNPKTNVLIEGGVVAQTKRAFENMKAVLDAAGCSFNDVVKVNVYLKNVDDFAAMNEVYASLFDKPYPARATVEVAKIPKGALIEVDCIAYLKKGEEGCEDCDCEC